MSTIFQTKAAARLNAAVSAVVPLLMAAVIAVALTFAGCDSASSGESAPKVTVTDVQGLQQAVVNKDDAGAVVDINIDAGDSSFTLILDNPRGILLEPRLEPAPAGGDEGIRWKVELDAEGNALVTITGAAWKDEAALTLRIAGGGRDFAPYAFTLRCIAPIFTVNFVTDYGTVPDETISGGNTLRFPPPPVDPYPAGLYLEGWYADSGYSSRWDFVNENVMGDTTLYAKWASTDNAVTYTVTFDTDGKGTPPNEQTVLHGSFVTKPAPPPTAPGQTFVGWYKDSDGNSEWNFSTPVLGDNTQDGKLTLYAKWAPVTTAEYTVIFNNGGKGAQPSPQPVADGSHVPEPAALSDGDYDFGGWYKDPAFKYGWDFGTDNVTRDMTLYAYWTRKNYTVAFSDTVHGTVTAQQTVPAGSTATRPLAPRKEGWHFDDWYPDSACTGTAWDFSTAVNSTNTQDGTLTLHAKWTKFCEVTFDYQTHGRWSSVRTSVLPGETITAAMAPDTTDPDWTFVGWFDAPTAGNPWGFGTTAITTDVTVYAQWINLNDEDFGTTGAPIISTINVSSPDTTLYNYLKSIENTAGNYVVNLPGGNPHEFNGTVTLGSGVNISLRQTAGTDTIQPAGTGSPLFEIGTGARLFIRGPTLQGLPVNTVSLVKVTGGNLYLLSGSIQGNSISTGTNIGAGVYVSGGTFTMSGGTISGNSFAAGGNGGGVYVENNGAFNMSGGTINDNESYGGGGVCINGGTFVMSGGTIKDNKIDGMTGNGGGVRINDSIFVMSGGTISGNNARRNFGGGVSVIGSGGIFVMSGGTIDGNKTDSRGGGVYVSSSAHFTKTGGGTITGGSAPTDNTSDMMMDGNAVCIGTGYKKRNTTAGPGVDMDSSMGTPNDGIMWVD